MNELQKHAWSCEQRGVIEEFLDWLNENEILLGEYMRLSKDCAERMVPILKNRQGLLDEYFDIDPVQLDKERRELLEQARKSE